MNTEHKCAFCGDTINYVSELMIEPICIVCDGCIYNALYKYGNEELYKIYLHSCGWYEIYNKSDVLKFLPVYMRYVVH